MPHQKSILVIFLLFGTALALRGPPVVDCEYGFIGDELYCYLRNIQVTQKSYRFKPQAQNNTVIRNVVVEKSTIPVLGSDICEAFENLAFLSFGPVELETVRVNAFTKCNNLKTLSLTSNKIEELDKDTFKGLETLETLYLAGNRLARLDDDLFADLTSLTNVHLYFNRLGEFSTALIRNNARLTSIFLFSNDLFDFDVDGILDALPELESFIFDDNNINCNSVKTIVNKLSARKIDYEWSSITMKHRNEEKIFGILCLADREWNAEYQKRLLQDQTREINLRNFKLFTDLMLEIKMK